MTPRADLRTRRASAGTLLTLEARTKKHVGEAVDESVDEMVATGARQNPHTMTKAAILALLLLASRSMAQKAAGAIERSRAQARLGARSRLRIELGHLGIALAPYLLQLPSTKGAEDRAHAVASGEALAVAWRALAMHSVLRALRMEKPIAPALEATRAPMRARIVRTAVTETSKAYNDEHAEALPAMAQHDVRLVPLLDRARVLREWSAMLDACPTCFAMDGERARLGGSFRGGLEPGYVHPRCRCIAILVADTDELSIPEAA